MSINIENYKAYLQEPWGKIQYDILFAQLEHIQDKTILDFGAGLGMTSNFLSQKNQVLAIEPNQDMLEPDKEADYQKILGSLDALKTLVNNSFDVLICHNVMEYIEPKERQDYFYQFKRVLKPQGLLSIVKHNQVGKLMQTVVLENDVSKALQLLKGEEFESVSFAQGWTYSIEDLLELSGMRLEKYQGMRTFYSLQANDLKSGQDWLEQMTKLELAVCDLQPYKDISFLQHVWLVNDKGE
ncbi:class I SAM-dependent methyltransferase [Streptococcus hongkongensis]|nr:SAM-dependent methyltransferase [Streptococcus uberis]